MKYTESMCIYDMFKNFHTLEYDLIKLTGSCKEAVSTEDGV